MAETRINTNLPGVLNLIPERDDQNYTVTEKIIAISFLDASRRQYGDELVPSYAENSRLLNVPESTLRHWWRNREEIHGLSEALVEDLPRAAVFELSVGIMKILRALDIKGYENMSTRDLTGLLNTYISKLRLLTGKGAVVDHKHTHRLEPVPPKLK